MPNQRNMESRHKSCYIHTPTFWSLLQQRFTNHQSLNEAPCPENLAAEMEISSRERPRGEGVGPAACVWSFETWRHPEQCPKYIDTWDVSDVYIHIDTTYTIIHICI